MSKDIPRAIPCAHCKHPHIQKSRPNWGRLSMFCPRCYQAGPQREGSYESVTAWNMQQEAIINAKQGKGTQPAPATATTATMPMDEAETAEVQPVEPPTKPRRRRGRPSKATE